MFKNDPPVRLIGEDREKLLTVLAFAHGYLVARGSVLVRLATVVSELRLHQGCLHVFFTAENPNRWFKDAIDAAWAELGHKTVIYHEPRRLGPEWEG